MESTLERAQTRKKVVQTLTILAVLILFYAALWILRHEVKTSHFPDVLRYLHEIPLSRFWEAFGMCLASYLALTFYDFLGLWHIQKSLSYWRIAMTSFIAFSFSHNIGAAVITGGGIRYRLYTAWGLTAGEAGNVILICGMTFWIGFLTMGAVFFFLQPPELPPSIHLPFDSVFSAGVFCIFVITLYLLSAVFFKKTIRIMRWKFPTPSLGIALGQMAAGCLDWTCSGTALYLLLPPTTLSFPSFMAIYLLAQITGFASQVPGGLGVLETVMVILLTPMLPASDVLGAMLAFRLAYYVIPFVLGLSGFTVYEIVRNKEGFKRALQILNRWAPDFAPHIYAILVFFAGGILFFSNATPEVNRRMVWLNEFMPLSFMEGSHVLVGLVGAGLLVVARGLQRRLEGAHSFALVLLGLGALGCLFKGFDYQETLTLLVIMVPLLFSRRYFPRKASLFQQSYPPVWVTAVLFVWLGSIWVGVFNYRYEDYSTDLWTTFDLLEDAARFLRGTLGATVTLVLFSVISLLSPTQAETEIATRSALEKALEVVKKYRRTYASLALLGDKTLLFNKKSDAFLMYAIEGKSWITMGDPVGVQKEQQYLSLKFKDLCRRQNASALFFGLDQDHFQFYLDIGLTVMKMGEEARVPLKSFKIEALSSADLKNTYQRFKEKEDFTFEVLTGMQADSVLPELKVVSEEWLSKNKTREKGFLTGFFQEDYLKWFHLAVVRKEGKVIAFASLWQAGAKEEAAIDLLRSSATAPAFIEDYLWLEVFLWAKEKSYEHFNLGTAPLLDIEESPLAPFKTQLGEILSPYGNGVLLQDIRKEKERFNPEWSPKYLAASGNLPLHLAFNNIRDLVAKGPWGRVRK